MHYALCIDFHLLPQHFRLFLLHVAGIQIERHRVHKLLQHGDQHIHLPGFLRDHHLLHQPQCGIIRSHPFQGYLFSALNKAHGLHGNAFLASEPFPAPPGRSISIDPVIPELEHRSCSVYDLYSFAKGFLPQQCPGGLPDAVCSREAHAKSVHADHRGMHQESVIIRQRRCNLAVDHHSLGAFRDLIVFHHHFLICSRNDRRRQLVSQVIQEKLFGGFKPADNTDRHTCDLSREHVFLLVILPVCHHLEIKVFFNNCLSNGNPSASVL